MNHLVDESAQYPINKTRQIHYKLNKSQFKELHIENRALAELALQHQTPLFVYSKAAMLEALSFYQQAFLGRNAQICYAVKANANLAILQVFAQAGCGFDTVSIGEIERALKAGALAHTIIFSGVGKTRHEMRSALQLGVGCFSVESEAELYALNEVALACNQRARVGMRVNPDVDAQTHAYITTGLKTNKFGIAYDKALQVYQKAKDLQGIELVGISCHIGSQITQAAPFEDAVERMLDLVQTIEALGNQLEYLDFGGGLGIDYDGQEPVNAATLWQKLWQRLDARGYGERKIFVEPGRSLVGNAGVCVSEVLYLKHAQEKNFCIIDAAMNDLPRPAMYQAFHRIVPLQLSQATNEQTITYDVVGPVCESSDWIGRDRTLDVKEGDFLAVLSAGAYCMSMSSNYNARNRCAEVLVDGDKAHLIRQRDTLEDQIRGEKLVQ